MAPSDEDTLVDWLKEHTLHGAGSPIGDDCAFLQLGESTAVTVDTQIEGVHFVEGLDPALVARRLLAVNLSDLAAVGAEPTHAFLALSAPEGFEHRRFFEALLTACRAAGVQLSGGDLSSQPRLFAALTLMGSRRGRRFVRRSDARPGHRLWLGGATGESALGLRVLLAGARPEGRGIRLPSHLDGPRHLARAARRAVRRHLGPRPQLSLGRWLAEQEEGAAIDISDGLAKDLHRLCRASRVGAEIDKKGLPPFSPSMRSLAESLDQDPLDLILGGGEDYVLLFTAPPDLQPPTAGLGPPSPKPIGWITEEPEDATERVLLRTGSGSQPLGARGFDHLGR